MAGTVSDFMLERLGEWGVERIYGYPGDGINGILGALGRAEERFYFIQVPHEEVAAFMACAHAKFTGRPGVWMATSGPGAIHLLNGLYDARLDHAPVVAIVGQQRRAGLGGHYQQEVDLANLFKDVARDFVQVCMAPAQMRHLIDRAMRIAMAERAVACIIVPADVQEMDAVPSPPRAHGSIFSSVGYSAPKVVPAEADLQRAAEVLNAGERVAMLVGAGALHATDEVIEVAEILGAGVAKALIGRAALPDDLPFVTGSIGLLGSRPSPRCRPCRRTSPTSKRRATPRRCSRATPRRSASSGSRSRRSCKGFYPRVDRPRGCRAVAPACRCGRRGDGNTRGSHEEQADP